jgi:hypothetical protein
MVTMSYRTCPPGRTAALTGLAALVIALPLSACSSGTSGSSGVPSVTAAQAACQQVDAALSDGPDPGTDPVGYAQAQVLPLRQISTPDTTIRQAIDSLASAYSGYATANGASKAATATLNAAIGKINGWCPGAGASL